MRFYADLHIHSKYSRATSKDCDLEHLAYWGRKKGITVIGTGDFTHPAWIAEIKEKLVPAEPGLFRLRDDLERKTTALLPLSCQKATRFMLSVEISTIYKKGDRTRKVHHLVYAPSVEKAEKINAKLGKIGNIRSDGRPILGLDSRHLLEIVLSAGEDCYLVPAHIWTPWFAVLGSKSGFDSVADCYGDLADHVFAVETGLSSDPQMNWMVSSLDRYRLMSNSDAHSPPKLGREACVFNTGLDYYAMKKALETGFGYEGTVEFFPEEGKYHLDGHRKCNLCLEPAESRKLRGLCPLCQKPLTLGVLYRVNELADRETGNKPENASEFKSIVPLPEILSEILQVGPSSQKVMKNYESILHHLGSEFEILNELPLDRIEKASSSVFREAVLRMRNGTVIRQAGYDGEYGVIRLFNPKELEQKFQVGVLFDLESNGPARHPEGGRRPAEGPANQRSFVAPLSAVPQDDGSARLQKKASSHTLDEDQSKALAVIYGPLLILAGPGSGKTRTLTHRVAHLITTHGITPEECLTMTFTRRAADEMRGRLKSLLPKRADKIPVMTFHALGMKILEENRILAGLPRGFRVIRKVERLSWLKDRFSFSEKKAGALLNEISKHKRERSDPETFSAEMKKVWEFLESKRDREGCLDYDDLLFLTVELLEQSMELRALYQNRYRWISVDEYQDMDPLQYQLVKFLSPENGNLCVIGDPDQSIYRFRGARVEFFLRFEKDFPAAKKIKLSRNYRSGESILSASLQMISQTGLAGERHFEALLDRPGKVIIHEARSEKAEAEFIASSIEKLIGGVSFFSIDTERSEGNADLELSFSDIAVLYRMDSQGDAIEEAFHRLGLPYQRFSNQSLLEDPGEIEKDQRLWEERSDRASLLTLHSAKGLEFPVVFIAGCEDGILPLKWGQKDLDPESLEEERRLFFVGMTRAKDRLFLSHARKRFRYGKIQGQKISPFVQAIEERLLERFEMQAKKNLPRKDHQMKLFD